QPARWQFRNVADWQRPLVEAGLAGLVIGIVFLFVAKEIDLERRWLGRARLLPSRSAARAGRALARKVIAVAAVIGCRDFAGVASFSLASIYLQKAHGLDAKHTGFIVGWMMLVS